MKRILILAAVLAISVAASAQPGRWADMSRVVTDTLHSEILGADREFRVFTPQNYKSSGKSYPVLYLLHGLGGKHTDWSERGHLKDVMDQLTASGEACDMIIVMPNAGSTTEKAMDGYFNVEGWAYEDFFFKELIPYVEKNWRVKADKGHRALAGLSMGGGGTTKYAQHHPDMFCAAYAMSALMSIPRQGAVQPQRSGDKVSVLNTSVIENSCIDFVKNADDATTEALRTVSWFVDCGDDDFLLDRNIEFVQAMKAARIPLQFRVRDGGHTWEYWHSALYTALPFISRSFDD
ncbi:MAG: esterase family protein [Bacteroidales bacterium]|nr:esterase family protein [Bacteroidales bacterium]